MSEYYSEEIVKDTRYRKDYYESVAKFLDVEKDKAAKERADYLSPEKYKADPEKYRNDLIKQLGFPLTEKRETPALTEKTFVVKDKNVNIYRMTFEFPDGIKFYGMFFEQVSDRREKPFVICLHGGGGTPEIVSSIHLDSGNYNHLLRRIADKGANVFAPQLLLWNTGTYGNDYNREQVDGKLRQLGGSVTALELYLMRGCIDYFIDKELMNAEKIGVAGLSYGGMYSLFLAAVDERIKACYSCSWVNDCFVHSRADWSYFKAQKGFAVAETAGIIAPRRLVVAMGDKDELFDSKLTVKECEKIQGYYDVFGKSDNFKCVIFGGVHETDESDEEINFLLKNL